MLLITSIIVAILTIIFIKLSFAVIGLRRKNKVGLGSGGHEDLERAIRTQANFAEYIPLGVILIACLEYICILFLTNYKPKNQPVCIWQQIDLACPKLHAIIYYFVQEIIYLCSYYENNVYCNNSTDDNLLMVETSLMQK